MQTFSATTLRQLRDHLNLLSDDALDTEIKCVTCSDDVEDAVEVTISDEGVDIIGPVDWL
jgi:hypothetical protein